MAGERVIKCVNSDGIEMTFNEREFNPFLLAKANGIYDANINVSTANNTMIDGAVYQGSIASTRNIVLILKDLDNFAQNREQLDVLFAKGNLGVLTVYDNEHERQIEYYTESITSTATPDVRLTTISLIFPNPNFYDTFDTRVFISDMMEMFEFPHEFVSDGEEFSYINTDRIATVVNDTADNDVGLTIAVTTTGTITNPSVTKVETNETLAVGYTGKTFTMTAGDVLVFTTTKGNKNVTFTHDGTTTDINEYLTDSSSFFQLTRGVNTFGYNADSNPETISIVISYRFKYMRA